MKPFLGVDLTTDKKNVLPNGNEFLVQKPSAVLANAMEASLEQAEEMEEKAKIPLAFRIVQSLCGLAALVLVCGILKADVSFAQGYANAPALYWICGICAVIWLPLWLWGKSKAGKETEEDRQTVSRLSGAAGAVYQELGVPRTAKAVDVLSFCYKMDNGEVKVKQKALQIAPYMNLEFRMYRDGENIYLANLEGKYAIPLSSVVTIHTVEKHIRFAGWNKTEAYNKGIYKPYKLTVDNTGCVHCKRYHILEVDHQGERFGIYFPCYELPVWEDLRK